MALIEEINRRLVNDMSSNFCELAKSLHHNNHIIPPSKLILNMLKVVFYNLNACRLSKHDTCDPVLHLRFKVFLKYARTMPYITPIWIKLLSDGITDLEKKTTSSKVETLEAHSLQYALSQQKTNLQILGKMDDAQMTNLYWMFDIQSNRNVTSDLLDGDNLSKSSRIKGIFMTDREKLNDIQMDKDLDFISLCLLLYRKDIVQK